MNSNEAKITRVKKCALCEAEGVKLTKEHTLSNFLTRDMNNRLGFDAAISAKNKSKVDNQNLTSRDVCKTCNNIHLQKLDDYAKDLHQKYFSRIVQIGEQIHFRYDYKTLSQWVIKNLYNAVRKLDLEKHHYSQFAKFCIGKSPIPANYLLFLFLMKPYKTSQEERNHWKNLGIDNPPLIINPWALGIQSLGCYSGANTEFPETIKNSYILQINSYNFVLMPLSPDYDIRKEQKLGIIDSFMDFFYGEVCLLKLGSDCLKVRPSFLTYYEDRQRAFSRSPNEKKMLEDYLAKLEANK